MTDLMSANRVPVPTGLCYHSLMPGVKPAPKQWTGTCGHNYGCSVCGFGMGCSPDPCLPDTQLADHD